ncbi:cofilin [Saitoella complicata NRRL Y-17804]|uniref:cofilin n=1 Tax=Saitoella complicata (strain BCRC 22490 / CBS 7301 / JCM 7358 / NBRC 10748 / NRRL Y-17804) TaxID=698492 RepID=UPI000867B275|nr:cofilin [Saitoella complicata NRRL Y-17804]ODQ53099.1 cofilin [Saitoella complicata NRRL Y-17804]
MLMSAFPQSRSGVAVSSDCQDAFNDLQFGKKTKFIVFRLNDARTEIIVEKTSNSADYEEFLACLPENDCRYAVYDVEFEKAGEGKRNKIAFYTWSPDTAPIKSKMVYASSKESLRRSFNGIGAEIQGTEFSEVSWDAVLEKMMRV